MKESKCRTNNGRAEPRVSRQTNSQLCMGYNDYNNSTAWRQMLKCRLRMWLLQEFLTCIIDATVSAAYVYAKI